MSDVRLTVSDGTRRWCLWCCRGGTVQYPNFRDRSSPAISDRLGSYEQQEQHLLLIKFNIERLFNVDMDPIFRFNNSWKDDAPVMSGKLGLTTFLEITMAICAT